MELFELLKKKQGSFRLIRFVTAGETDKVIPVSESFKETYMQNELPIENTEETLNINKYEVFQVRGESMCTSRIFDQDYIFVKPIEQLEDKLKIPNFSTVVFHIDPVRERLKNPQYIEDEHPKCKLRKFVMYVDLRNQNDDAIFASVLDLDKLSSFQGNRKRFIKKITEARNFYREGLVILSTTYKEGERDYSFHGIEQLAGIVEYYAKPDMTEVGKVTSVNDSPELYEDMVEHLAKGKISRFFYGINNTQAIIVLSKIFISSEKRIRMVSSKLSEEITNNERYKNSLISFLNKPDTTLEILVYEYDKNNPIYDLLGNHKEKVIVKYSKTGAKLGLEIEENDCIINFCIGDDRMFRLETNVDLRMAECNFRDTKTSENLIKKFNSIFDDPKLSEPIPLP